MTQFLPSAVKETLSNHAGIPPADVVSSYPTSSRLRTPVITYACIVVGLFAGPLLLVLDLQDAPDAGRAGIAAYITVNILFAVGSWILLPFALRHVRREFEGDQSYPGTPGTLAAILGSVFFSCGTLGVLTALVVQFSAYSRRSGWWSGLTILAFIAGMTSCYGLAEATLGEQPFIYLEIVGAAFVSLVPVLLISMARGYQREKRWRVVVIAEREAETARRELDEVVQKERDRISRDMHDSLSHRLSLISVHAGALAYSRAQLSADQIRTAADTIQKESKHAVEDLRTVLRVLRTGEEQDPGTTVSALVEGARAAGEKVELRFAPGMDEQVLTRLPTVAQHAVHRAVQEGLTNARKHAPGQPVTISVAVKEEKLSVTMTNPHPGQPSAAPGAGQGLVGMQERARMTGGRFNVEQAEDFSWTMEFPLSRDNL